MKSDPKDITRKLSASWLAPIVSYLGDHRGALTDLAERLTRASRKKCHKQYLQIQLHPDSARRKEMGLGYALLVRHEFEALKSENMLKTAQNGQKNALENKLK